MKTIPTPFGTRVAIIVATLSLFATTIASAQQLTASDTGRCINAINKGMRKVTLAASKDLRSCVAKKAGGLLGPQTVLQCIAASPSVQNATIVALISADNSCDGVPPAFGPHSISLHGTRAVEITQAYVQDLFGTVPDSVLATNSIVMS
ncbi:MAG: hypothetical protein ABIR79_13105, partial [Candidatus Binatia bacterium]